MSTPLSYLEISREALRHNVSEFRKHVGDSKQLVAVVKANAYGHGLYQVVSSVSDLVDAFQVDDIEELRELRHLTQKRALVLGYIQPSDLQEAVSLDAELAIFDTERLPFLAGLGTVAKPVKLHLKVDALLGRQGLLSSNLSLFLETLRRFPSLKLVGVYSHFSNLEDTESLAHSEAQLADFERAIKEVHRNGFTDFIEHMSATSGIMQYEGPGSRRALVRLGIGMYGYYPSEPLRLQHPSIKLLPALRWVTHVAQVKDLPEGYPVGYGVTYVAQKPMQMAVVPQGYSDGLPRLLSNQGAVLISGTSCPIIGRIAMNMCMVDVSTIPGVKAGDEVVLIGTQGDKKQTATDIADLCSTIDYEILARLSPLLPRLLL